MFVHGGISICEMFFHTIADETSGAPDVVLVTVFVCNLVNSVSQQTQLGVGDGAIVSCACALRDFVREGFSEGV